MKNQYYGDVRDLFKYDLAAFLIRNINYIEHFTFIPMLTPNDGKEHGQKLDYDKAKAGTENKQLRTFLMSCTKKGRRDIREIKKYFASIDIDMTIYKEKELFSHDNRSEYFRDIGDKLLSKSLVLLDPDNGMEVKTSNLRHVLLSEIEDLYDRMSSNSVLMVYQHFPRAERYGYIQGRSEALRDLTGEFPAYISDNEIAFFFLTKKSAIRRRLSRALADYHKTYNQLEVGNIGPFKWSPKSIEDKMLFKYWQENGGALYLEVPIGNSGKRGGWPPGSKVRRIDGVRIPKSRINGERLLVMAGDRKIDLYEIFRNEEVEIIEVKNRLNRVVFGQAVAGAEMFNRQYKPKKIIPVVLYREGDPAMEWVCHKSGVQAIEYGTV